MTLPVLLAYGRGTEEDRDFWSRTLIRGEIGDGDLENARRLMDQTGSLADTLERARHYAAIAHDALAPLPDSAEKAALLEALAFCVSRAY